MALRELVAVLGYKVDAGSETKVKKSLGGVKKLAIGLGAAFGARALVRGFSNIIKETRAIGDEVDKTSQRLGVNAQALQELQFAAGLAGASNADVVKGLRTLTKNAAEAADGTKSFVDDFAKLGVTVTDTNGNLKSADQLFAEVGDGLQGLATDSERLALAQVLVGRAGTQLIPLFNQGSEAIAAQRKEARELGGVYNDDLIKASVELTDDMARLDFLTRGLKATFAAEFIPILVETVRKLTTMARELRGGVRRGAQFLAVAFKFMSQALVIVARNLPTVLALFVGLFVALFPMAALLTLLSGLILLVVDDLNMMGSGGSSVIGGLIGEFQNLLTETDSIIDAIGGIFQNAIKFWTDMFLGFFGTSIEGIKKKIDKELGGFAGLTGDSLGGSLTALINPLQGLSQIPSLGGGGGGSVANQSSTSISVEVNAQTGANAADIATQTANEVRKASEDANRVAFRNLSPS